MPGGLLRAVLPNLRCSRPSRTRRGGWSRRSHRTCRSDRAYRIYRADGTCRNRCYGAHGTRRGGGGHRADWACRTRGRGGRQVRQVRRGRRASPDPLDLQDPQGPEPQGRRASPDLPALPVRRGQVRPGLRGRQARQAVFSQTPMTSTSGQTRRRAGMGARRRPIRL